MRLFSRFGALALGFIFSWSPVRASAIDGLAGELAGGVAGLSNKKVAVLPLAYHDGKMSSGSSILSERLTMALVGRKGVQVIERRLMQEILAEKKLAESGAINPEGMKAIGQLLDVDALVLGTLIDFEDGTTEINARMIRIDTGEILSAGQRTIKRSWRDRPVDPPKPAHWAQSAPSRSLELSVNDAAAPGAGTRMASVSSELRLSNNNFPEGHRFYHPPVGWRPSSRQKRLDKNIEAENGTDEDPDSPLSSHHPPRDDKPPRR